jgi:hypothetical protein
LTGITCVIDSPLNTLCDTISTHPSVSNVTVNISSSSAIQLLLESILYTAYNTISHVIVGFTVNISVASIVSHHQTNTYHPLLAAYHDKSNISPLQIITLQVPTLHQFGFNVTVNDFTQASHDKFSEYHSSQSQCAYNVISPVISIFSKSNSISLHAKYHPENIELDLFGSDGSIHVIVIVEYNNPVCESIEFHHLLSKLSVTLF